LPRHLRDIFLARLHGVNAQISISVPNEVPVKIVTVRLRKPRPSKDTCQDLAHFFSFTACSSSGFLRRRFSYSILADIHSVVFHLNQIKRDPQKYLGKRR
jgi:hypothetical protein